MYNYRRNQLYWHVDSKVILNVRSIRALLLAHLITKSSGASDNKRMLDVSLNLVRISVRLFFTHAHRPPSLFNSPPGPVKSSDSAGRQMGVMRGHRGSRHVSVAKAVCRRTLAISSVAD